MTRGAIVVVLAALVACASAVPLTHMKHNLLAADAGSNCDCSWARPATCGNNDNSVCFQVCCGVSKPSTPAPAPVKPVAPAPSNSNCNCAWASANTCGNNDGTPCFQDCCGAYTNSAACKSAGGSCMDKSYCGSHPTKSGLCPGSSSNICCLTSQSGGSPTPSTPSAPVNPPSNSGSGGYTDSGVTTRYWDCCKPSCAWSSNTGGRGAVATCSQNGASVIDSNAKNVCAGGGGSGTAYTCSNQQPFLSNGQLYGFVATQIGSCCDCFELMFTSTGKTMIVQRTNTGGDLSSKQFDIAAPGGGFGIFDGCATQNANGPAQWGVSANSWGARYGGVSSRAACSSLPSALVSGCQLRFDYFNNNPAVKFKKVTCPSVLTAITGCRG